MDERAWLGAALFGRILEPPPADLAGLCKREGVTALLFEALGPSAPDAIVRAQRGAIAWQMAREPAVRAVLAAIAVPFLVLKGEALANSCYRMPHLRAREDLDLLFASEADARQAADALSLLGYSIDPDSWLPDGVQFTMVRPELQIDLHWRLSTHPILGKRLTFADLHSRCHRVGEPPMDALSPVDAFLHAAIHRMANAQIGAADRLIWLYDFVVLSQRFDEEEWSTLVARASDLALAAPCVDAMRACTEYFQYSWPMATLALLKAAAAEEPFRPDRAGDRVYLESQTPNLWRRLVPSAAYMRARYRLTNRGSLPLAYLRRWMTGLKLLWRAIKHSPR